MSQIISIDGPVASGKTSIGLKLAGDLGYQFIDAGTIYRAGAFWLLKQGKIENIDDKECLELFATLNLEMPISYGKQRVILFGYDITEEIRSSEVSKATAFLGTKIAAHEAVFSQIRTSVLEKDSVVTGRNIGSIVLPNAQTKLFITADPQIRARRRFDQLRESNPLLTLEMVYEDIISRDYLDMNREVFPFVQTEGAFLLDTTNLSFEEAITVLHREININPEGRVPIL